MYNHEWFLDRLEARRPGMASEYEFIEEYTKSREPIKAKHKLCGREISLIPNSMISRGTGCSFCSRDMAAKKQLKSHKDFVKELPESIEPLEKYKGAHKHIKVRCSQCGETYMTKPHDITREGRSCARCSGTYRRTVSDVRKEISELTDNGYRLISNEYINPHSKVKIEHKKCGNIYEVTRANFRKGKRCPDCASSKGERYTAEILDKLGIPFEPQKTFEGLILKSNLYYDFHIPTTKILIEYQGIQHYQPVTLFGGQKQFEIQKEIDSIKRAYAKDNGYTLIEIPYTCGTSKEIKQYLDKNMIINSVKH